VERTRRDLQSRLVAEARVSRAGYGARCQADHGSWPPEIRDRAVAAGFSEEKDVAGYEGLRRAFPMDKLKLLGDEAAQAAWLLGEIIPILGE
jgi:hypothetical protein